MHYIGLDHHRKFTQVAVVNDSDDVVLTAKMSNSGGAIEQLLQKVPGPRRGVVEAGPSWGWIYDAFRERGVDMVLANPLQVRVIAETRCKTDRRDALALARLLRAGWIPAVYVGSPESRLQKQLWRERTWLVRMQVRLKNRIRQHLVHAHVEFPEVSDLFGAAGRRFLEALDLRGPGQKLLMAELALLQSFQERIRQVQGWAQEATLQLPEVRFLQSLPGLGLVLAPIVALEIGDIDRFPDAAHLASYCGLVPSVTSSGGLTYRGSTRGGGNHWLKWAFVEAAWAAMRTMPELRARFVRIKARRGASIAAVACARTLCEIAFVLLKHRRVFEARTLVHA